MKLSYHVIDPTGNITLLVETPVPISDQPAAAAALMALEPEAEQVGFLSEAAECDLALRMAGGEFCGNASMSAAMLAAIRADEARRSVILRVSGAAQPVTAEVEARPDGSWQGTVDMPAPKAIRRVLLPSAGETPVVELDGITHVILEQPMPRPLAERSAPEWCQRLNAAALGIMFLNRRDGRLVPLVYVPGAGTLCWETSCASGTTAAGAYLAADSGCALTASFREPGGILTVAVSENGEVRLTGTVRYLRQSEAEIEIQ